MKEKERFELIKEINECSINCYLKDNKTSMIQPIEITCLINLLNQQSKQTTELKNKLAKQSEWIENNKNKAKNCAIQMNNQAKEITRLKQSNKDLMRVICNTKRERAKKGREICKANNYIVAKDKQIAELQKENQLKQSQKQLAIKILKELRDKFCNIGYNGDYDIDYFEVMKEIDDKIKSLKGEKNE